MVLALQGKSRLDIVKDAFRAYDIRGTYPEQIDEDLFYQIGKSIATKIQKESNEKKIIICMDGRLTGPLLKKSLIAGLIDTGIDIIDIGILPTPLLYFSLYHLKIDNGLMITGSHNPKNYNGIKIVINKKTLFNEHIMRLFETIKNSDYVNSREKGVKEFNNEIVDEYINEIRTTITIKNPFKVVIDCGNGVTGAITERIFNAFNVDHEIIHENVDGNFPNHPPDPSNENNLLDIKKAVMKTQSELGIAYDGDGDRIIAINADGEVIWPDELMIIFSRDILKRNKNAKIVYDVKCTANLEKEIKKNGGIPILSRTGHSFIKKAITEEKAKLGGEMSGHIFFADKWYGFDDGIYTSLRLLEILTNNKTSNILTNLPKSISTPEINIPFDENNHIIFMKSFVEQSKFEGAKIVDIDGLKIIYDDSWGLIRCSNTTSSIVLRFEADTDIAMKNIKSMFKKIMLRIDNALIIPF